MADHNEEPGIVHYHKDIDMIRYMLETANIDYDEFNDNDKTIFILNNEIEIYFDDEGKLINIKNTNISNDNILDKIENEEESENEEEDDDSGEIFF